MKKYEVLYRDTDGIMKHKGFKYEEDYTKFVTRLEKKGATICGKIENFHQVYARTI